MHVNSLEEAAKAIGEMILSDSFKKIKEMYYSENSEDISIAKNWLIQLVGEAEATANLFVLDIYRDIDNDSDLIIDENTYIKMKFKTFKISFGKNYRYEVTFDIKYKGEIITDASKDFSRYQVGDGDPKYCALEYVCKYLRFKGFNIIQDLYK